MYVLSIEVCLLRRSAVVVLDAGVASTHLRACCGTVASCSFCH
jgi:hypothetical protein